MYRPRTPSRSDLLAMTSLLAVLTLLGGRTAVATEAGDDPGEEPAEESAEESAEEPAGTPSKTPQVTPAADPPPAAALAEPTPEPPAEPTPAPSEEPTPAPPATGPADEPAAEPVPVATPAADEGTGDDEDVLADSEYESVVTASRRASSWKDAPGMVTVVPAAELELAPEQTVDDVLKRVPSVSFSRLHVAECGPGRDITLRGIHEQKRTLILVDGVPVNDGVTGAVNWSMVPKEAVDRIEIVRGPMSALYGSGAMGGVINIITKRPRRPNETTVTGGYGSLDTSTATLLQGGGFELGGYLVGGHVFRTAGYVQAKDEQDYHVKNARTDVSLLGKFFVFPDDDSRLNLNLNYVNEDFSRGIRTDEQNNQIAALGLTYDRKLENHGSLTASGYAQFLMRKVVLGARPDFAELDHTEFDDSMRFGELLQASVRVAGFNTITAGIDTHATLMEKHNEYYLAEREAEAAGTQLLTSLFVQDEMEFTTGAHRILLTPGVRLDYSRSSDGESSDTAPGPNPPVDEQYQDRAWVAGNPKLSLVYRYAELLALRASVGRSFAAPTLFELYTVFTRGPMLLYGNPELEPESAWSTELGLDVWILPKLLGRLTGYYTRGEDFIGYRSITQFELQVDNITEIQAAGLDAELRFDLDRMLSVYGGYTFNWSTVIKDAADDDLEGNHLPFEPQHRARLGVRFRYLEWIRVDLSARYTGARYVDIENTKDSKLDQHVSLDLGLSGTIAEHLIWALAFENLLDWQYDVYSVPTDPAEAPGVLINGSLTLAF